MKCKPFASPKDFCKQFLKIFFKNVRDRNTVKAALPILQLVCEVLGSKDFGKHTSRAKGALKDDIERAVADAEKFKKGKYRKPEKEHIIGLIRKKKKEEARRAQMGIPADGTGLGDGKGLTMGNDGIPRPPVGPLPETYIQLRCTKKEEIPIPVGGEMEEYGAVVEKWLEVTVTNAELFGDNQVNLPTEFEQKEFKSEMKVWSYT